MAYTIVRLSRELVDEIIQERLRPDAQPDWVYDVVVEVDEAKLLKARPKAPTMKEGRQGVRPAAAVAKGVTLSNAIQSVAPV